MRLRHSDEWIGLLVIAAFGMLVAAIMQAGLLRDWFKPVSDLRLILPESGVAEPKAIEDFGPRRRLDRQDRFFP